MTDLKKTYRDGADDAREAVRDVDGHDAGDDVANVHDKVKTTVANVKDDVGKAVEDVKRAVDRNKSN